MTLGIYTKALQERLNNEALQNDDNDFIKIYDGCINEYLENRNNKFINIFLNTAQGDYLDIHGKMYGIFRKKDESDEEYRNRIILNKSILQRTTDFSKLDIGFWVYKEGVTDKDTLTSRNPYLKKEHDDNYIFICSGADIQYLQKKFLLNDILFVL